MTSYETIFKRFSNKITDIKLLELADSDVLEMCTEWLLSSIAKFTSCKSDLENRSDETLSFAIDLIDIEIEILAIMMVGEWLEPQLNSTLLTSQFYGGKEDKFFAQSNQLEKIQSLSKSIEVKTPKLMNSYKLKLLIKENLT